MSKEVLHKWKWAVGENSCRYSSYEMLVLYKDGSCIFDTETKDYDACGYDYRENTWTGSWTAAETPAAYNCVFTGDKEGPFPEPKSYHVTENAEHEISWGLSNNVMKRVSE